MRILRGLFVARPPTADVPARFSVLTGFLRLLAHCQLCRTHRFSLRLLVRPVWRGRPRQLAVAGAVSSELPVRVPTKGRSLTRIRARQAGTVSSLMRSGFAPVAHPPRAACELDTHGTAEMSKIGSPRDYSVRVLLGGDGKTWRWRIERQGKTYPVQRSAWKFPTKEEAEAAGETALAEFIAALDIVAAKKR